MTASDAETIVPSDLAAIPQPRIGFVGMIDPVRFDAELIRSLAAHSEFHFVLVGGLSGGARDLLPDGPNIHWLGMKPVSQLPAYLKGIDVCIMPYRLNEATHNIYPLKLHEYLATGKPVVSTAIPAVEALRDLIYVADTAQHFADLLQDAVREADPTLCARRRNYAQQHNWDSHVQAKSRIVREQLK
jgi:glycosyltransferase involved in cell wall biosynthesis